MSDKAQSSLGAAAPGSERTPSRDRAGGEDPPRHLPTMGELAAWRGRRRWVWVAAAGVVVVALVAYDGTVTATSVTAGK
jgi:hypothetical protein